jgi:hypothetical protein
LRRRLRAVDLADSGRLSEAERLLADAAGKATDLQTGRQIQALLDRMSKQGHGGPNRC